MFQLILTTHSHWRWILLLVAVVAAVKFLIGLLSNGKVSSIDKLLGTAYAWAITIQLVLGVINLINYATTGLFNPRIHIEHAFYGIVATGLAHAMPIRKDSRPDRSRFLMSLVFILISLLFVLLSVIRLRGTWMF